MMDNIVTTVGRRFLRQITHMTRNEWSLVRSRKVASRHRNLQLRRLDSLRSITSGFSVGLRGLSRLIYLIPHYIIHADFKDTHVHTDRPAREPDADGIILTGTDVTNAPLKAVFYSSSDVTLRAGAPALRVTTGSPPD